MDTEDRSAPPLLPVARARRLTRGMRRVVASAVVLFALAGCGGGGGTSAGSVPPPAYPPSATASAAPDFHHAATLAVGPIAGGIAATLGLPPLSVGSGAVTAALTSAPPAGVPTVQSARRAVKDIGATSISPLAYVLLTASKGATLGFYGAPTFTFTVPPALAAQGGTAYLVSYPRALGPGGQPESSATGWFVAAPGQPLAASMSFAQVTGAPFLDAGDDNAYALVVATGPVAAPTAAPSPSPAPAVASLALNPARMALGGLDACPASLPNGTSCSPGYNAFPVDPGNPAARVRFRPLTGVSGAYQTSVDDPAVATVSQPFLDFDGQQIFGVVPVALGTTTVRVRAPNGQSAALPVVVTTLTVVIDATRLSAGDSFIANTGFAGGFGIGILGQLRAPAAGGSTYTILNAGAYAASGDANDLSNIIYTFAPVQSVYAQVNGARGSAAESAPVTIVDGQANSVTLTLTPP